MKRFTLLSISCVAAMWAACTVPSENGASRDGTWQVTIAGLDSGMLTPAAFAVVVSSANTSFAVAMPTMVWNHGPMHFDTLPLQLALGNDTAPDATLGFEEWCKSLTCMVGFWGHMNVARDSVQSGTVMIFDTATVNGVSSMPKVAAGTFTAHK